MKHLFFSLRFLLLFSFLIGIAQSSFAWKTNTAKDGINYIVYITGEKYNAVADSACVGNNRSFTGMVANISSNVTYEYKWSEIVGYDTNGHAIYETITRYLTAPVTSLVDWNIEFDGGCFHGSRLTSVSIPNTVKRIGAGAFYDCSKLTDISISNSVKSIGNSAFSGCRSLTSISLPNSITSISDGLFNDCRGLTNVNIPSSVTSVGKSAFTNCYDLAHIYIPNSVTSIGSFAFCRCICLTDFTIPYSVHEISESLFQGCSNLIRVTIPNSVTSIGSFAFYGCRNLTSVSLPSSLTTIGGYAFSHCDGLTEITIPKSVTAIEGGAFANCSELKSLYWNADNCAFFYNPNVVSIPPFDYCYKLSSIIISGNTELISGPIFKITDKYYYYLECLATRPPVIDENCFYNYTYSTILYVPKGTEESYRNANIWKNFKNIVGINEPGDVNGDGSINISDVTALIDLLLSGGEISAGADVNGDGHVDISDVTALIDRLLSGN